MCEPAPKTTLCSNKLVNIIAAGTTGITYSGLIALRLRVLAGLVLGRARLAAQPEYGLFRHYFVPIYSSSGG
jgi:hypothetical protein